MKKYICGILLLSVLAGCGIVERHFADADFEDHFDRSGKLSREDYKKNLIPSDSDNAKEAVTRPDSPPMPKVSPILVAPRPPKESEEQVVSIAVTEDIPLRDVFIELARLANVDLELDTGISGGIIFRAKDRPLGEVVKRICHITGLRYSFEGNTLKISRDTPFVKSYPLDFLNIKRSNDGGVTISTNVLSAGEGESDSVNTGSKSNVKTSSETDLWENFEQVVTQILESAKPTDPADGGETASTTFHTINKEAGLLTVYATRFQHEKISEFVQEMGVKTSQQVLIEAKIVEVTLDDEFRSGIDWNSFSLTRGLDFNFDVRGDGGTDSAVTLRALNPSKGTLEAAINLTEKFGTTRTLSSPRVHAINNQQAILTFAENEVYFELDVQREQDTSGNNNQQLLTVDSTVKTVPIGIIVVVQPSINPETGEITMNVRPTLSRVVNRVPDPAVAFLATQAAAGNASLGDLQNLIPVVEVREMDTIMKVKSGDIMVMGGMMEERSSNTDTGVPWVSGIPWIGNAFKDVARVNNTVEMVIFIKATIVPTSGAPINKQDIKTYKTFTNDPRPLTF